MEANSRRPKGLAQELSRVKRMMGYEMALWKEGVKWVAGVDEAGRGPLAGPVVAAAVILPADYMPWGADDSKKLSPALREELALEIKKHAVSWAIASISPSTVDEINIYQAAARAMQQAVRMLLVVPGHVITDAMRLKGLDIPQTPLIKGDSLSISVACASILAKVERDRIMREMEELYPGYGFGRHKGYATKEHLEALSRLGPCPIHRKSFEPVRSMLAGDELAFQGRLFS